MDEPKSKIEMEAVLGIELTGRDKKRGEICEDQVQAPMGP